MMARALLKRAVMWLYNHGMLSERAIDWLFSTFDLRSA